MVDQSVFFDAAPAGMDAMQLTAIWILRVLP
jgi:hypothetical protein